MPGDSIFVVGGWCFIPDGILYVYRTCKLTGTGLVPSNTAQLPTSIRMIARVGWLVMKQNLCGNLQEVYKNHVEIGTTRKGVGELRL